MTSLSGFACVIQCTVDDVLCTALFESQPGKY